MKNELTTLPNRTRKGYERLFLEEISGHMFWRCPEDVIFAEYELNRLFNLRGYALLNDLYRFLMIPETEYGKKVGWNLDLSLQWGYSWIDFYHKRMSNVEPNYFIIKMPFPPCENYDGLDS